MNTTGNLGGQDDDAATDAQAARRDVAQHGSGAGADPRAGASKAGARSWPVNRLRRLTDSLKAPNQIREPEWPGHASIQSVQAINAEAASYATTQIAVGPNMMIAQAGGLVAQAAANYFEASTSLAIAGKSVLMKDLAQKTVDEDYQGMAMDAMGLLLTDLFVATAAMVAGAAEAIEGEAASIALDKIDESLKNYQALLDKKGG
ncbi:hypothetical protein [Burkholderia ubonensis]|uniref:Uncharacterized protein n=1 Tax=Burkholderia ubonensis TaxID=101571 RepID=A0AB74CXX2_9BURK|nr:hypothetical protein [Burkholderia ubonensis]PAJ79183.1 hypothetical protein CJO71_20125 [Burkholderia ubonensis]PAJ84967.1 hypothetical protein CJO70_25505 [Burkholderia ubonensis]PAJ91880.1 hypothetical protein CJO69_25130 [Burkholderia ubonensis]PAJ98594.1 hypothetical protein CJO68_24195 [Burkholderia ubonensis]PAK04712.1 hypothetical protein CJO67_28125 [Burkholderia ubonensis]